MKTFDILKEAYENTKGFKKTFWKANFLRSFLQLVFFTLLAIFAEIITRKITASSTIIFTKDILNTPTSINVFFTFFTFLSLFFIFIFVPLIMVPLNTSLEKIALNRIKQEPIHIFHIFHFLKFQTTKKFIFPIFLYYLICYAMYDFLMHSIIFNNFYPFIKIIINVGLIFILTTVFYYYKLIIAEKNLSGWQAILSSFTIARQHSVKIFKLLFVLTILMLLSTLPAMTLIIMAFKFRTNLINFSLLMTLSLFFFSSMIWLMPLFYNAKVILYQRIAHSPT